MNLFGNAAADGQGRLIRHIAIAGAAVAVTAVVAASLLDRAARDGSLNSLAFWGAAPDPSRMLANAPRPSAPVGGIRYGAVDYMPTASIPANRQRVRNVVSDPSLGMPD